MRNLTLILCGVALAASVASGLMFFLIGNSKQALLTQLGEAEAHGEALADDLAKSHENSAALTEHLHQLDAELGTTKHAVDQANITQERLRSALELAEVQRVNATAVADEARNQLRTVQTELISTRDQLAQSIPQADAQRYRKIIADLESTVGALENQLESAKSTSPPPLIASRAYHAQVMQVASRNAFVVINYGKSHGAVVNQRFTIKRGLNSLAVVEISDSTDNYSIAQVLPETLSGILRTGDAAIITP